jgi:hypothetical protein
MNKNSFAENFVTVFDGENQYLLSNICTNAVKIENRNWRFLKRKK